VSDTPDLFERYPAAPGSKGPETSAEAARSMATAAPLLRDRVLALVRDWGGAGLTADECAAQLAESVLSVRPRFSELQALCLIEDSGQRRKNLSGRNAVVWIVRENTSA